MQHPINQRLEETIEKLGYKNIKSFTDKLGLSTSHREAIYSASSLRPEKNENPITIKNLLDILEKVDMDLNWLIKGKFDVENSNSSNKTTMIMEQNNFLEHENQQLKEDLNIYKKRDLDHRKRIQELEEKLGLGKVTG